MDSTDAAGSESQVLLGRYRIEKTLGRGGMGEVLLAYDELLHRPVALKRLTPGGANRAELRHAILREARRASRVSDRHVAQIYDVIDLPDEVLLVMEFVDGATLRERMRGTLGLDEFWALAPQCAEGVVAAHAHGVIHRDLKPENFIVTRTGEVKMLDFGIARRTGGLELGITSTTGSDDSERIVGTPYYMAPEAFMGGLIDERTDVFSLGVVFFEMLTGRRPFQGDHFAVVVNQVLHTTPPEVRTLNPGVSASLSALIGGMLAKNKADRVATASEVRDLLAGARRDPENAAALAAGERAEGSVATIPGAGSASGRRTRPRSLAARSALAALLALAGVAGVVLARNLMRPGLPRDVNLAVLPVRTPGSGEDFASFAAGAMSLVQQRLQRHADTPGYQMALSAEVLDEEVATPGEARKILGTNVALQATLEQSPDRLAATFELRDCERDRLIASRRVEAPRQQPFQFLDRMDRATAALLGRPPASPAGSARGIRGAGTLRYYLQGIGRMAGARDSVRVLRALEDLESAARTEPDAAPVEVAVARAALALHQMTGRPDWLRRADAASRRALESDSSSGEAHLVRAAALGRMKRNEEAAVESAAAAARMAWSDEAMLRYARSFAHLGDPDRERDVYLEVIRRRPHDWRPHWWLATLEYRRGRIEDAIREYREMARLAPDYSMAHSNLAGMLILRGEYVPAIAALQRSIELQPTSRAYANLGNAYFNSGRFDDAIESFNQSFQFGEPDYRTWANLGDCWLLKRRPVEAVDAYQQAIRLGREEAEARARRGATEDAEMTASLALLYARVGRSDSARTFLRGALRADSSRAQVQYFAALTEWELGDRGPAMAWLERSVRSGHPKTWLRDSPMFRDWRTVESFRVLIGDTLAKASQAAARSSGG